MAVRKGQLFILGSLLIATLIMGIVFLQQGGGISVPESAAPQELLERSMDEFPSAVNVALAENDTPENVQRRMHSYMAFQTEILRRHATSSRTHAMISVPNATGTAVLIFNFRRTTMRDINVTIGGVSKQPADLSPGETTIVGFGTAPGSFTLDAEFVAGEPFDYAVTASRDKVAALYAAQVRGESQAWEDARTY